MALTAVQTEDAAKHPKSASGQNQKSAVAIAMSAFHPIATKQRTSREVRLVPGADI
jgi:hypothetical protein